MSTAKLKSSALKPSKAAAARTTTNAKAPKATVAFRATSGSSGAALETLRVRGKGAGKTVSKSTGSVSHKAPFSDRLLRALGPLFEVNITDARTQMPKMIRSSVGGKVFLIGNAKSTDSPPAVLIGMAELERVVQEAAKPAPGRTLGDVLASLPFSGMELRPLRSEPLPGDSLPMAHLPR
jgi:hypothetical protein